MTGRSIPELLARAPRHLVDRVRRPLVARWRARYFERNPDHPAIRPDRAMERMREATSVLFLCWGNVCRSPVAERLLRTRLAAQEPDPPRVASAGLGRTEDRPSPPAARAVARRYGVDLADHRSTRASEPLVARSDVVFVMDYTNFHTLATRYPSAVGETFLLGPLAGDGRVIEDPHGRGPEAFDRVYATIEAAIEALVDARTGDLEANPADPGG